MQGVGSFLKSTTKNGVEQSADNTGGVLAIYRFFFKAHSGVEANYNFQNNTQNYGIPCHYFRRESRSLLPLSLNRENYEMPSPMELLVNHGYTILFATVLAEQIGLPVPCTPFLIAAGALEGSHKLSILESVALAVVALLISDFVWFSLGRLKGRWMLRFLYRVSPELYSYDP